MARQRSHRSDYSPEVRVGRIPSLPVYQISEYELEILARGSPNSTYLNLAIALVSVGLSFIIALATAEIGSMRIFTVFVVIAVTAMVVGTVLLVIWFRGYRTVAGLVDTIRGRLPPAGEREQRDLPPPPT